MKSTSRLSSRAREALDHAQFYANKYGMKLEEFIASDNMRKFRGVGPRTLRELRKWAGVKDERPRLPSGWLKPVDILDFPEYLSTPMKTVPILVVVPYSKHARIGTCNKLHDGLWWRTDGSNSEQLVIHWRPLPRVPKRRR